MSHYFFEYDRTYSPPASTIEVGLEGENDKQIRCMALVDSGADGTLVPVNMLADIGAIFTERRRVQGIGGLSQYRRLYKVTIHVGNQAMFVNVVEMPRNSELIIGRNILNRLKITLDGFSLYTTVETVFDD